MARISGGRRVKSGLVCWMGVEGVEVVVPVAVLVVEVEYDERYGLIELSDGAQIFRSWMSSRTVSFHRWPVV